MADTVLDAMVPETAPAPAVAPAVAPDAAPDAMPDAAPDAVPDAAPDAAPDAVPDAAPDAVPAPVVAPAPDAFEKSLEDAIASYDTTNATQRSDIQTELDTYVKLKNDTLKHIRSLKHKIAVISTKKKFLIKKLELYRTSVAVINEIKVNKYIIFNCYKHTQQYFIKNLGRVVKNNYCALNTKGKYDKYAINIQCIKMDLVIVDNKFQFAEPKTEIENIIYNILKMKNAYFSTIVYDRVCGIDEMTLDNAENIDFVHKLINMHINPLIRVNYFDFLKQPLYYPINKNCINVAENAWHFWVEFAVLQFEPLSAAAKKRLA